MSDRPVRVAQLMADVRPYRIGLLERIAAREDVDWTIYAGSATGGQGAPERSPDVAVRVIPVRNRFWPRQPLKVLWQAGALGMLRSDADVLLCQEVVSNPVVWIVRILHRVFGKRLVLQGFFYRAESGKFGGLRDGMRRLLRSSASALIPYTERGRSQLIEEGVDPARIFVNANTVDTERLMATAESISDEQRAATRESLGVGTLPVLAFLGRLRPVKRVEVVVEAVRQMNQPREQVALLVIGDGEERQRLERVAEGVKVIFAGATYDDEEIADYLSIASLLVLPGSVGLTCVHGFANALPTITTFEGATFQTPEYEYVEDGVNGVIVDRPEPLLFAQEIGRLLADDRERDRLSDGARATAQRLGMGPMAEALVSAVQYAASVEP